MAVVWKFAQLMQFQQVQTPIHNTTSIPTHVSTVALVQQNAPVSAIFADDELPEEYAASADVNAKFFK